MVIHGLFDVGKVAEILDCNGEAPYVDEDVLGFLLKDEFDPSVSDLNASTSTDEALREIAIALQEEQNPPVLVERKPRFKTLTEKDLQTIEDTRQSSEILGRYCHFLAHAPLEQVKFFITCLRYLTIFVRNEGPSFLLFTSQFIALDTQVSIVFAHSFCVFYLWFFLGGEGSTIFHKN